MLRRHTFHLGSDGESLVIDYMTRTLGLRVLKRNVRIGKLELDIIAHSNDRIVFCEVRTRSSTRWGHPLETFDAAKRARTRRCAADWLRSDKPKHLRAISSVRFDVATVVWGGCTTGAVELRYVEGAF